MNEWRRRAHVRRRARRRHLAAAYEHWRAVPPPARSKQYGQARQVLLTLAWLLVPGVLAAVVAAWLWLTSDALPPAEVRPELGLLVVVPMLVLWLVRRSVRR